MFSLLNKLLGREKFERKEPSLTSASEETKSIVNTTTPTSDAWSSTTPPKTNFESSKTVVSIIETNTPETAEADISTKTLSEIIIEFSNDENLRKIVDDVFFKTITLNEFLSNPLEAKRKLKLVPKVGEKTQIELINFIQEIVIKQSIKDVADDMPALENEEISIYEFIQDIDCSYYLKMAVNTEFFKTTKLNDVFHDLEGFKSQLGYKHDLRETLRIELIERIANKGGALDISRPTKTSVETEFGEPTTTTAEPDAVDVNDADNKGLQEVPEQEGSIVRRQEEQYEFESAPTDRRQAKLLETALDLDDIQKSEFTLGQLKVLTTRLGKIDLSVRLQNCLSEMNCTYVYDVAVLTEAHLMRQRGLGRNSIYELKNYLSKFGLTLGTPISTVNIQELIDREAFLRETAADETLTSNISHKNEILRKNVKDLGFSVRARNILDDEKISYLGDLCKYTERDLKQLPNMGFKTIREIQTILGKYSLTLGEVDPNWTFELGTVGGYQDSLNAALKSSFVSYSETQLKNSLLKIENLEFSVRAHNLFKKLDLVYLGEVCNFEGRELTKLPNMGITTVEAIEKILINHELRFGMWFEKWTEPEILNALDNKISEADGEEHTRFAFIGPPHPKFLTCSSKSLIEEMLQNLSDRHRDILERRAESLTLEEIGNYYEVTRERIRQLESAANMKLLKQFKLLDDGFIAFLIPKLFDSLCEVPQILDPEEINLKIMPKHLRLVYMALGKKFVIGEFKKICNVYDKLLIRKKLKFEELLSEKNEVISLFQASQLPEIHFRKKKFSQQVLRLLEADGYYAYRSLLFNAKPTIRKRRLANIFEMTLGSPEVLYLENCLSKYQDSFPEDPCSSRDLEIVVDEANGLFAYKRFGFVNYYAQDDNQFEMQIEGNFTNESDEDTHDELNSSDNSIVNTLHNLFNIHGPMTINDATQLADKEIDGFSKNSVGPTLSDRQSEFSRILPRMYYSNYKLKNLDHNNLIKQYDSKLVGTEQVKDFICFRAMGLDKKVFTLWSEPIFEAWRAHLLQKGEHELLNLFLAAVKVDQSFENKSQLNQLCKQFLRQTLHSTIDWTKVKLPKSEEFFIAATFLKQTGYIGLTHCNFILGRQTRTSQAGIGLIILLDLIGFLDLDTDYFGIHQKNAKFNQLYDAVKKFYTEEIVLDENDMMKKVIDKFIFSEDINHQRGWYFYSDFQNIIGQKFDENSVSNIEAEFELMHLFKDA